VQVSLNPFASDHVPFLDEGLPAVLTIEGADHANDRIHTAADTLDHIDLSLAYQILRMNTAYVASLAGS
jgi:Zn-dependent M28 family amino/carboxypeptidase